MLCAKTSFLRECAVAVLNSVDYSPKHAAASSMCRLLGICEPFFAEDETRSPCKAVEIL